MRAMEITPEERQAMRAKASADRDQSLAALRENPEFSRGGYPLLGNPETTRAMHVDVGNGKPRCTACGCVIFGDENWLPNTCSETEDERHLYPNGEKARMSPLQREVARVVGEVLD
jgi:hypothetical protein